MKEVQSYENNFSFGLLARKVRGQKLTRIVTEHSGLLLTDSVSVVKVDKLIRDITSTLALTQTLVENP